MMNPTGVPAGWYADPTGRHEYRYWEGSTWTDVVADGGRTATDPSEPSPSEPSPSEPHPTVVLAKSPAPWATPAPALAAAPPPTGPPVLAEPAPMPGPYAPPTAAPGFGPPLPMAPPQRTVRWWIPAVAALVVLVLVATGMGWFFLTRPGPRPEGLSTSEIGSNTVGLTWSAPKTGKAPETYVVRRNGSEVGRLDRETTFKDSGLTPLTTYRYSVRAIVAGKTSSPIELVVHTIPASPGTLTSSDVTTTSLVVNWSAPQGVTPDKYIVLRDGSEIATVDSGTLWYKDASRQPLSKATYTVIALTKGKRSDPSTYLEVTTLPPPLSEARLQESWDVTATVTKPGQTRLKTGETSSEAWTFTPKCPSGPCPVQVSGTLGGRPFTMTLNRSGNTYRGSGKAKVARCMSVDVTNTLSLTLRVTAGEPSGEVWAASNWSASLDLTIPYTRNGNYYCPTQTATFGVSPNSVNAAPST